MCCIKPARIWKTSSNECSLRFTELRSVYAKIFLRGCFNAVNSITHFDDIEVNFHDALFVPNQFDKNGKISFEAFTDIRPLWEKENIFGCLLGNGAATA